MVDLYDVLEFAEHRIPAHVSKNTLTERSCASWINEMKKIDKRSVLYLSAIALLQTTRKVVTYSFYFIKECIYMIENILGRNLSQCCSVLSLHETKLKPSEVVDFLLKSAAELLTTYRQIVARDFGSVVTIVTTDFEAMYAYKRGNYQRCLQLSTQNVHTLLYARRIDPISLFSVFLLFLDDDIVSVTALIAMINDAFRFDGTDAYISQLTLSLYLMTQCQLKLHHSVTSLAQTLDYIDIAQRRHPPEWTMDLLTLKLNKRRVTEQIDAEVHFM